jgi:membrane protein DedA with SNARE-associated domain/membrane-associated phospholipid phosphatase
MPSFLSAVAAHPHAVLLGIFLIAWAESLAVIGTLVPAAIVMFGAGALVGAGSLELWTTLGAAVCGAVLGDGFGYELGRSHEARVRAWRVFQRHTQALARGEDFIRRHGGKSILLARFAAPVRAFVPLLAGFAHMPRSRFYAVNVLSALVWAPVLILPGVLFGASLQLAEAVSGRLAVIVLLLVFLLWFAIWLTTTALRFVVPWARRVRDAIVGRARGSNHRFARVALMLLDPASPGSHALLLGALLLLGAGWLFLGVLEDVISHDPLVQADIAVFNFLQGLRTASVDRLLIVVTEMGSVGVMLPLVIAVALWLAWRRCWRTAWYWIGVTSFGEVLVQLLKFTLGRTRPLDLYTGVERFSFPSGHAVVSTVILGFLAFLLSRGQATRVRLALAAATGVYVALVAFSRLYLGAHWLSDVLGGLSLGAAWVAMVAMIYTQRQVEENFEPRRLALVVSISLLVFGGLWAETNSAADLARYSPVKLSPRVIAVNDWLDQDWRLLPARRSEVAGDPEEPFALQWACGGETIRSRLGASGWRPAQAWSLRNTLAWLSPEPQLQDLPALPRFDRGNRARLVFVRWTAERPGEREVLRLWSSGFELQPRERGSGLPIWYGAIYREEQRRHRHVPAVGIQGSVESADAIAEQLPIDLGQQLRSRPGLSQVVLALCRQPVDVLRR